MTDTRPPLDVAEVIERIDRAEQEVFDLCSGKRRWTMTVPAEPDRDSDLLIGGALADARKLLAAAYQSTGPDDLAGLLDEASALIAADTLDLSGWVPVDDALAQARLQGQRSAIGWLRNRLAERGGVTLTGDTTPKAEPEPRGAEAFDAAVQRAFEGAGVEVRTSFTPTDAYVSDDPGYAPMGPDAVRFQRDGQHLVVSLRYGNDSTMREQLRLNLMEPGFDHILVFAPRIPSNDD